MCDFPSPARPGVATVVTSVAGAVLAGGASSRMGRPKALIEIDGRTLLDRAVGALTAAAIDPVIVVGGDQAAIEAAGHRFVPDEYPGEGPLGGIISALGAVDTDLVVVLACDLLAASPDAVISRKWSKSRFTASSTKPARRKADLSWSVNFAYSLRKMGCTAARTVISSSVGETFLPGWVDPPGRWS